MSGSRYRIENPRRKDAEAVFLDSSMVMFASILVLSHNGYYIPFLVTQSLFFSLYHLFDVTGYWFGVVQNTPRGFVFFVFSQAYLVCVVAI